MSVSKPFIGKSLILVCVIVVVIIVFYMSTGQKILSKSDTYGEYPSKRTLLLDFQVQNSTPRLAKKTEIRTYFSANHPSTQQIGEASSTVEYSQLTDGFGNVFFLTKMNDVAAGSSIKIGIKADYAYRNNSIDVSEQDSEIYLQSNQLLEGELKEIFEGAKQVSNADSIKTVKNIISWLRASVKDAEGVSQKNKNGAGSNLKEALTDKNTATDLGLKLSLSEKNRLFIAACQKNGIPARAVVGVELDKESSATVGTIKIWAEYFHDNSWRIVDLNKYSIVDSFSNFYALRILGSFNDRPHKSIELYLFETRSINVVPGSLKIRLGNFRS